MKTMMIFALIGLLPACAVTPQQQRIGAGALTGGAVGAGLGAVFGDPGRGAATGAIVGGALGAANAARQPYGAPQYGYGGRPVMMDCNLLQNPAEIAACKRGQERGAPERAQKIAEECQKIGQKIGYEGRPYPVGVAEAYAERDLYKSACSRGLARGYGEGENARLKAIEENARRHEAGDEATFPSSNYYGDPWGRPSYWDRYRPGW